MKEDLMKYKFLTRFEWIVLSVSVLLYIGVVNAPFKAKPFGDLDFHIEAKALSRYAWGAEDYQSVSITKAPGPVFFYFVPYFLVGPDASDDTYWLSAIIWSGLFMSLALLLINKSCINFGSRLAGRLAVFFILLIPIHLYYSLGILAESLAFIGCCVMVFGYSRIYSNLMGKLSWSLLTLGLLAIILARPNAILIIPLLVVFVAWQIKIRHNDFYIRFQKQFILTITALIILVASVSVIVKSLPNKRKTFNQEGYLAYVAIIGRYQFRTETWDWRFWDTTTRPDSRDFIGYSEKMTELRTVKDQTKPLSRQYSEFVLNDIVENPLMSIKQFFVRTIFGHTLQVSSVKKENFGIGPLKGAWFFYVFHIAINLINYILLIFACWFLISKRSNLSKFGILAIPWMALIVFHGIIYMEQRYLFPVRPVMIVLASLWIAGSIKESKLTRLLNRI